MASYGLPNGSFNPPKGVSRPLDWYNQQRHDFQFKPSVFYEIQYRIGEVKECERMSGKPVSFRPWTHQLSLESSDAAT